MRMNKYLASTLFTGLFLTAAALSPAMGQEQSLQPQGAWAITKVDRSAQGGSSYCTLSRKYDDNIVLSLGRNQTEEYSLAIDFQKPVFDKDKALKINLQPGPGQLRAYDMMPTSDKAMVVRLGWDTGFFDTLNQSQQMKVKIADKSYSFAMPEIAKGQDELKDCMEGLKAAAKGGSGEAKAASTKDVLNAEPGKASAEFEAAKSEGGLPSAGAINAAKQSAEEAEKGLLASFAEGIRAQEPQLNGDNEKPRKNFGKSSASDDVEVKKDVAEVAAKSKAPLPPVMEAQAPRAPEPEVQPELIKRPAPVAVAEAKVDAPITPPSVKKGKGDEAATAKAMAATAPAAAAGEAAQINSLEKRISEMSAENSALKQQVAAQAPASAQASSETQKQLDALQAEKKTLQQQIDVLKQQSDKKTDSASADLAAVQSKMKELEIKNAQLEDSLRQSQTRIAETAINTETKSMKKIIDLEGKLEAAQKDNNELARQLESFKLQQEDGRLNVIAGDWNLEQATKRFNEAEREIRRLGLQLEQERSACNREKAEIENMLFDPAVTEQKQIERLTQLQKDLDAAKGQISDNQKQIQAAVDQQLAAKTQGIQAEKAALSQQVASLQKSLADKDASVAAEKAALQNQVASIQKSLTDKDASVAAEKTVLQNQVASMQKQLADTQTVSADKARLTQQVAELQKQAAESQKNASSNAALLSEKTALQSQIDALKVSLGQKDQELAGFKAQPKVDPAAADLRVAQEVGKARAAADQEISALKAALGAKDKAVAEAQAAAATAAATPKTDPAVLKQLADLQSSMADVKKDNDALRDQNIVLRQESDKLRLQLADVQTNGAARADRVASIQLDLDEAKRQLAMKDRQNATYQNQLASIQQENTQLKNRLSVSDTGRTDSNAEVGELTRQVQALQRQISDMERRAVQQPAPQPVSANDRSASIYNNVTPAAGYVSSIAATAAAVPVAAVQSAALSAGASGSGYDRGSIQSLLQKAGLSVNGLQKTGNGFVNADNYAWTGSNNVKGLASVRMMSGNGFDDLVNQYISFQKGQCNGDFASMPSPSNGGGGKRMALYEVACVGSGQSLSSSILFFEDQGRFIAISNQIPAADMDIAMDNRDRVANFVRGL